MTQFDDIIAHLREVIAARIEETGISMQYLLDRSIVQDDKVYRALVGGRSARCLNRLESIICMADALGLKLTVRLEKRGVSDWPEPKRLVDLNPVAKEMLYEFEETKIFTAHTNWGLHLVYFVEKDGLVSRYISVPVTEYVVNRIKDGTWLLRSAFSEGPIRVIDLNDRMECLQAFEIDVNDLPEGAMPGFGVYLKPRGVYDPPDEGPRNCQIRS